MTELEGFVKWTVMEADWPAVRPTGMAMNPEPTFEVGLASVTPGGRLVKPTWSGPAIAELLMLVTVTVPLKVWVTRL
jgi:hypothetical protein